VILSAITTIPAHVFNFLVNYSGWAENRDTMSAHRTFEYTSDELKARFAPEGKIDFERLLRLPTVFAQETAAANNPAARVGTIFRATQRGSEISIEYAYDPTIPPIPNESLESLANELGIDNWELSRTHWAIKEADLFRALLRVEQPRKSRPRVFTLNDPERIEGTLISAMMPFNASFDAVYQALRETAEALGLRCRRADDIWENPAVIQDVVSLIDRSRVVICDCTGRNPNVFYETGIAHAIGRDVVLITQNEADIPFDLRHLRFVVYLNNGEGRQELRKRLEPRLRDLSGAKWASRPDAL
jgi:hypothetical protein